MNEWLAHPSAGVPTPRMVADLASTSALPVERVPFWAAHWLTDGYDGDDLCALAGLSGQDPHEVREPLPGALAECGVRASTGSPESRIFTHVAVMLLEDRATERWVADKVEEIVGNSGWDHDVMALPMGRLYEFPDEWDGGWGRTEDQLKAEVRQACVEQIRVPAQE